MATVAMPGPDTEDIGSVTAVESEDSPMSDDEFSQLLADIESLQLATDQHAAAEAALKGRTVTCAQGGDLLGAIRLGLMKRMVAFGVLRGRISDLPQGLPALLRSLSGQILQDVGQEFGGDAFEPANYKQVLSSRSSATESTIPSTRATPVSPIPFEQNNWSKVARATLPERRYDWAESVERLRSRMVTTPLPDAVYQDVRDVFDALGFGELPAQQAIASQMVAAPADQTAATLTRAWQMANVRTDAQPDPGVVLRNASQVEPDTEDGALDADLALPGQVLDELSPRSGATSEESV